MSSRLEMSMELFNSGFNCAQSVFAPFCEKYGLSREYALKISSGLGAGVRSGEICGVVSGAVLVVGLKHGQSIAEDSASKSNCYAKTSEFIDHLKMKSRFIICRELLGCDVSTKEGHEQAKKLNLFKTICANMVKNAVVTLEELGY